MKKLKEEDKVDVKKVIKDLAKSYGDSNEEQGKMVNLMKGLAFSDDAEANKFMKALDKWTTEYSNKNIKENKMRKIEKVEETKTEKVEEKKRKNLRVRITEEVELKESGIVLEAGDIIEFADYYMDEEEDYIDMWDRPVDYYSNMEQEVVPEPVYTEEDEDEYEDEPEVEEMYIGHMQRGSGRR